MDIFSVSIDTTRYSLEISVSWLVAAILVLLVAAAFVVRRIWGRGFLTNYELSEVEIGVGNQKIKVRASHEDLQVAYMVWAELSTRKLAVPIDLEHDLIADVYDSWYKFFGIVREMIKSIPVTQVWRRVATREIVNTLTTLLNDEMRPHLTRWQACYRHWWDAACKDSAHADLTPLELQQRYPEYTALMDDLVAINRKLVGYKETLERIVLKSS